MILLLELVVSGLLQTMKTLRLHFELMQPIFYQVACWFHRAFCETASKAFEKYWDMFNKILSRWQRPIFWCKHHEM